MRAFLAATALIISNIASASVRADLEGLYPEQSGSTLQTRIDHLESPKDFFRSFTPYFHLHLRRDLFQKPPWNQLGNETTWCLGDPHPENFGALLSEKGLAFYGPNDLDDAHPCPTAADLFRFLTGWRLWVGDGGSEELLATYFQARRTGQPLSTPLSVRSLLRESEWRGRAPRRQWYHAELGVLRRRSDVIPVPSPFDRELAQTTLKVLEGKGRVIQVAERLRLDGGSGGVKRFLALVQVQSGPLILEFKEVTRPAVFPWGMPLLDPFTRVQSAWDWTQKETGTPYHRTVSLFGRPFFTRPLWDGHLDFDLDEMSGQQHREIAHFQASLLGVLHRRSPIPSSGGNMALIPARAWAQAADDLAIEITRAYNELRGPISFIEGGQRSNNLRSSFSKNPYKGL